MDIEKVIRLVEVISNSPLKSFVYEEGNLKISLGKSENGTVTPAVMENGAPVTVPDKDAPEAEKEKTEGNEVPAPLVGIFYAAKSPDADPFVKVGDHVKKGQIIGIIEAMKLMNEVESTEEGIVKEICVANGEGVEYGQPLIIVGE